MDIKRKYFQTLLRRKTRKTYCNVLFLFYKGNCIAELYIDDIDPSIIDMNQQARKKWAYREYGYLVEDLRPDVLEDDEYFPPKVLSRKELIKELLLD